MRPSTALLAAAALAGCATTREFPFEQRRLAAVLPFAYTDAQKEFSPHAGGLADSLTGALLRTGRLRLVERARVEAAIEELRLQRSGLTDGGSAARLGRHLNADAVVLGSIATLSVREEGRSVKFAEKTTRYVDVELEARLVDVETGELLGSGRTVGKADSAEKHAFGGQIGALATSDALIQKALIGAGEALARDLIKTVPPKKPAASR